MRPYPFTILLVEDSADDAGLMLHAFKKIGVTAPIQHVWGAEEAIEYLLGQGKFADRTTFQYPSFILTDLKMSRGDGFALLKHLKSTPQFAVIPTVVYSSSDDTDDIKRCYAMGAESYIVKRSGTEELQKVFKTFFDYWMLCEVPAVDADGKMLPTSGSGKLGALYIEQPDRFN